MRYVLLTVLTLLAFSQTMPAAEVAGVSMADATTVAGAAIPLRGTAVQKWKRFWTVHATGWWQDPATAVEDDVAKVLELHYFHDIEADAFRTATTEGIARGRSDDEVAIFVERREQWNAAYRDIKDGQRYRIVYEPGRGTSLHQGEEELVVVQGGDFAKALFGIWIGEHPVEAKHRSDLLDGK